MPAITHVGTSGWQYRHWRGVFYPQGFRVRDWLAYYAEHFDCVEVNTTFYGLPRTEAIAAWRASVTAGFIFAVKAPRRITHFKKLKNCAAELDALFRRLEAFGETLGPVLFQLPPRWRCNLRRLEEFLDALGQDHRFVFEFRDPTWHNDDVYAMLASRAVAFCIFDGRGTGSPLVADGGLVYVRLHGPGGSQDGNYRAPGLRRWADRARGWNRAAKEVFLFFDNDARGCAVKNGTRILGLLEAA